MPIKIKKKYLLNQKAIGIAFFGLMILLGIVFRFLLLAHRGAFVFDELHALLFTQNLHDLKTIVLFEVNPPLYYWLLFLW